MLRHRAPEVAESALPGRLEPSASPGAGGAGTAGPERPPPRPGSPLAQERPALPGGLRGRGRGPGLRAPPHPHGRPTRAPWGPGRPASLRPRGSLPGSRLPSPGSILSRRSGEGGGGGRAPPRAPRARRTDGGGPRGAPGGPRAAWPGRGALPRAPRAASLGSSHRPRRGSAGRGRARRARAGRRRPGPAPLGAQAARGPVRQSVGPRAPAARRARVRTARLLFPPPPPRARWLRPRLPARLLNPCLAARRRSGSPAPGSPAPSLVWGAQRAVLDRPAGLCSIAQLVEESPPEGVRSCSGTP